MSESPADVVFALTGDVRKNSRALRQLRALRDAGLSSCVIGLGPALERFDLEPGIHVRLYPHPGFGGPPFFRYVHRLFSEAADIRARVYHASDLFALPAMHAHTRSHDGMLVYDSRELYPYVSSTAGRPWIRLYWYLVERRHIHHAHVVLTVSDGIADRLTRMYGIRRPVVLHNVPPARSVVRNEMLRTIAGIPPGVSIVLHQGQMRKDRGCVRLIDAVRHLRGAALVFLGDGPLQATLVRRSREANLDGRVHFVPPVPPDELLDLTASADIGVTLLEDTCLNHRLALPNKLFEYLMAGTPVLASDLPEVSSVVRTYDVGRVVDPSDETAVTRTLQAMIDDPLARERWSGNAPRVLEAFSWERESRAFIDAYRSLLSGRNGF